MSNKQKFIDTYTENFISWLFKRGYQIDFDSAQITLDRILEAIFSSDYSLDTEGLYKTCSDLNIKPTYKAIASYIAS